MNFLLMLADSGPVTGSEMAHIACEWLLSGMGVFMGFQTVLEAEGFHANVTLEFFNVVMLDLYVFHQRGGAGHLFLTEGADIWILVFVIEVDAPLPASAENLLADPTLEPRLEDIDLSVL